MTSHHAAKPPPLLWDRLVPTSHELVLDLSELRPHPLRDGDALELETPVPRLPTDVREPKKVERLRLPEATCRPTCGREPAELDQARLVGVQFQTELREPLAQVGEELLRVTLLLEPGDKVSSRGGVSPPGSRRTGREPLGSSGSHHRASRHEPEAPVGEEATGPSCDGPQPPP